MYTCACGGAFFSLSLSRSLHVRILPTVVCRRRPVSALRLEAPQHGDLPESHPCFVGSGPSARGLAVLGVAFSGRVGALLVWHLSSSGHDQGETRISML